MILFRLLCVGLVIHLIFLFSIFDIYFKSPIVTGVAPEPNNLKPLGKRVVLFSVDGLRADSLFDVFPDTMLPVAEHLRLVIKNRGTWGVSQTRVPTESRPGHIAMLAGFYEDPSAVTRGWKENPVDFDSIFNRSHCSFAWGHPDILKIFFKGLKHNCAFMEAYQSEQNFAGDTRGYDTWVYEKLIRYMKMSKSDSPLYDEGIFFFLHLLGQDTSGHTDKPHTENYRNNLKNVDEIIMNVESTFNDFYGDDKTTYIVTSDHGMTDWGSHGAGDLEEINTPFIAWGAGIKKSTFMAPKKINIEQASIAPLLAILLGASIPVNSVGILPIMYLNMSKRQIAEAAFLNTKQIIAQYLKVMKDTEDYIISLFHIPFAKLPVEEVKLRIWGIADDIKSEKYTEAIVHCNELMAHGLEGLNYYQNYFQKLLLLCISLSYLGWIMFLLLELFKTSSKPCHCPKLKWTLICVVFVTVVLLLVQSLPIQFYLYTLLPEFLWYFTMKKVWAVREVLENMQKKKCLYFFLCIMFGVEILVVGFFHRWCLIVSVGGMLLWSLTFRSDGKIYFLWLGSGCAVGLFSLLPVVGGQPRPLMVAFSGVSLCLLSLTSLWWSKKSFLFPFRLAALIVAVWNSFSVHSYFNENKVLLGQNQYVSWILLAVSFALLVGREGLLERLHGVFLSLSVPFLLLSISHEGFFLFFLSIHLFCWVSVESQAKTQNPTVSLFRIAYFFLTYIVLSFFGLGNTSNLNSFDPAWVRCFLTVFSPYLMSALILLKTIIPFLLVTCTMRVLTLVLDIRPGRLFVIVLIYCNVMGLNFLFLVKNKGSWLDIGISISHYVVQQVTIVFLLVLFGIAKLLTSSLPSKNKGLKFEKVNFVSVVEDLLIGALNQI